MKKNTEWMEGLLHAEDVCEGSGMVMATNQYSYYVKTGKKANGTKYRYEWLKGFQQGIEHYRLLNGMGILQ